MAARKQCSKCSTIIRRPVDHPINCPGLYNSSFLFEAEELPSKRKEVTREIVISDELRKK